MRPHLPLPILAVPFVSVSLAHCGGDEPSGATAVGGDGDCTTEVAPGERACAVDERYAVFVDLDPGEKNGNGTRAQPYGTIARGLDRAEKDRKRLYVCARTYEEPVRMRNGVSMYGAFTCADGDWRVSDSERARVTTKEAIAAITAKDVSAPTTLEGFDVDVETYAFGGLTIPNEIAVAMLAVRSGGIRITNVSLKASKPRGGVHGIDAGQPTNDAAVDVGSVDGDGYRRIDGGRAGSFSLLLSKFSISGLTCAPALSSDTFHGLATNQCGGGAGLLQGGAGGQGGRGSWWIDAEGDKTWALERAALPPVPANETSVTAAPGVRGKDGAPGQAGTNGSVGSLDETYGFAVASGGDGAPGAPGQGGGGGKGDELEDPLHAEYTCVASHSGGGGGAGGCPGLAGTGGRGGGGSFAIIAIDSPLTLESVVLVAGDGAPGAAGGFASFGQAGGKGGEGSKTVLPTIPTTTRIAGEAGGDGGAGGHGGSGGSGAGGHSMALAYRGEKPKFDDTTKMTTGEPGKGVAARTKTKTGDPGIAITIPASPPGIAAAVYEFK